MRVASNNRAWWRRFPRRWRATRHVLDGEGEHAALFVLRQADGFARVHRQRQRVRPVAQVEVDHRAIEVEVDAIVVGKRRDRHVHQAWLESLHRRSQRLEHDPEQWHRFSEKIMLRQ